MTDNWQLPTAYCLLPFLLRLDHERAPHRYKRSAAGIGLLRARHHLVAHIADEARHLALHFVHALAHLQNNRDTRDVHSQVPRQRQDQFQALDIFVGVEAGVAFGARRLQQTFAFVQAQRLRVDVIHLRHRADHVRALLLTLGHSPLVSCQLSAVSFQLSLCSLAARRASRTSINLHDRTLPCPGHSDSLSSSTQRSTTPIRAKPARIGDPGAALGYHVPSRWAGLDLRRTSFLAYPKIRVPPVENIGASDHY